MPLAHDPDQSERWNDWSVFLGSALKLWLRERNRGKWFQSFQGSSFLDAQGPNPVMAGRTLPADPCLAQMVRLCHHGHIVSRKEATRIAAGDTRNGRPTIGMKYVGQFG